VTPVRQKRSRVDNDMKVQFASGEFAGEAMDVDLTTEGGGKPGALPGGDIDGESDNKRDLYDSGLVEDLKNSSSFSGSKSILGSQFAKSRSTDDCKPSASTSKVHLASEDLYTKGKNPTHSQDADGSYKKVHQLEIADLKGKISHRCKLNDAEIALRFRESSEEYKLDNVWLERIENVRSMLKMELVKEGKHMCQNGLERKLKRQRGDFNSSEATESSRSTSSSSQGVKIRTWPGKAKIVRLLNSNGDAGSQLFQKHKYSNLGLWVVLEADPKRGTCTVVPARSAGLFMRGANAGQVRYKVVPEESSQEVSISICDVVPSHTVSHASSFLDKTWALLQPIEELR